jgi:hypothetical protein
MRKRVNLVKQAKKQSATKIPYRIAKEDPLIAEAMLDELREVFKNMAGKIVVIPKGRKPLTSTWVHKYKTDKNGKLIRVRSRCCPHGYRQIAYVDYHPDEVAAPTLSLDAAMIGLSIELNRNQFTKLVDVDKAFQISDDSHTIEKIYMEFPDGMKKIPGQYLEIKALQGTKHGAYNWHVTARRVLMEMGFQMAVTQPCYFNKWDNDIFTHIRLYVDDFRCSSDTEDMLDYYMSKLDKTKGGVFPVKVLPGDYWLGMEIDHDKVAGTMKISMRKYIAELLETYGMSDCKPVATPADPYSKLKKAAEGNKPNDGNLPYQEVVGSLLWLARTGRPDIIYAVNQCQRHVHNWDDTHATAAKRILRYLKGTTHLSLTLRKSKDFTLALYVDSDYGGEPEESEFPMRSTTGIIAYMHGIGPIFSNTVLEKTMSLSTAEAEYKGVYRGTKYAVSIRQFLEELGFNQSEPTEIKSDNQAAIAMAKQKFSGCSTRDVKIAFHYVREQLEAHETRVTYCPTENMVADIMTKALDRVKFEYFRNILLNML